MAATVPKWTDGSWDRPGSLWLGGLIVEAIPNVSVRVRSDIDVKKPQGKRGAKHRDRGDHPRDIKIVLRIRQNEREFAAHLRDIITPASSGDSRGPLSISHPNTDFWGVTAITIKSVDSPMPSSMEDWVWSIDAIEWVPAPAAVGNSTTGKKAKPKNKDAPHDYVAEFLNAGKPSQQGAAGKGFFD